MFSFSISNRRHRTGIKSDCYDEKKPRGLSKLWQTLKSCFGHGFDIDVPPKNEYQRANDPATGLEGEEVYGVQPEYLNEDDMAWGKPKKSKKRAERQNYGSYA